MKKISISTHKDILGFHVHVMVQDFLSVKESLKIRREINNWIIENRLAHSYNGDWNWTFKEEKDLVWFLLKWQ